MTIHILVHHIHGDFVTSYTLKLFIENGHKQTGNECKCLSITDSVGILTFLNVTRYILHIIY